VPFKSISQAKWMFANKPQMAKKWAKHTKNFADLPKKLFRKKKENVEAKG